MKLAFLIAFLFFVSMAVQSRARDLNANERKSLIYMKENLQMKDYVFSKISSSDLSVGEFATFQLSTKSCEKLEEKIDQIYRETSSSKDFSRELKSLNTDCAQGIVGLFKMAVDNKLL